MSSRAVLAKRELSGMSRAGGSRADAAAARYDAISTCTVMAVAFFKI
eukprot:SAG31_NODE_32140_length_359_cov_1.176923_1_plen_46_part_10